MVSPACHDQSTWYGHSRAARTARSNVLIRARSCAPGGGGSLGSVGPRSTRCCSSSCARTRDDVAAKSGGRADGTGGAAGAAGAGGADGAGGASVGTAVRRRTERSSVGDPTYAPRVRRGGVPSACVGGGTDGADGADAGSADARWSTIARKRSMVPAPPTTAEEINGTPSADAFDRDYNVVPLRVYVWRVWQHV